MSRNLAHLVATTSLFDPRWDATGEAGARDSGLAMVLRRAVGTLRAPDAEDEAFEFDDLDYHEPR